MSADVRYDVKNSIIAQIHNLHTHNSVSTVPQHAVEAIHAKHQSTEDHLREVIETFLNGVGSEPTWRVIIGALKSPSVNLPQLVQSNNTDTGSQSHTRNKVVQRYIYMYIICNSPPSGTYSYVLTGMELSRV